MPSLSLLGLMLLAGCAGGAPGQAEWNPPDDGRLRALAGRQITPDDLVGLSAKEVGYLFGEPSLVKFEAPADILQFANQRCVLIVFLYPDHGREPQIVVTHAETLGRTKTDQIAPRECVDSLIRRTAQSGV